MDPAYGTANNQSLDNGTGRDEFVRTHDEFHGRKRSDSVILRSPSGTRFAKVIKMYDVPFQRSTYTIALVQGFRLAALSEYTASDRVTGFRLLQLESPQQTFFVPVSEFIRRAFIVPVSDPPRPSYHLLNDVIDTDMFFRLQVVSDSLSSQLIM